MPLFEAIFINSKLLRDVDLCEGKSQQIVKTIVTVQNAIISQVSHRDRKERKKAKSRRSNDESNNNSNNNNNRYNNYGYACEINANNYVY